ncbi:MAG: DUF1854 domain-containing protein [Deferribacteres bacterium]|nr:DUF1854 domain-containing protein [candidate division KSB1 bacterium]MCB9502262.1 DUF1854 domain-containing protein [Deferribacteres bacterium]
MQKNTYILDNGIELVRCKDGKPGVRRKNADGEIQDVPVRIVRCFPWRHKDEYISIRLWEGKEVALLKSLDLITDSAIRNLLEREIQAVNYVPEIVKIESILDENELYNWKVITKAGKRSFFMRRNETPRQLENDGILIKDISGDRYFIDDLEKLDRDSKDWLWLYLD